MRPHDRLCSAAAATQDALFMNKPVYDHQSLDALVQHAYYVAMHLGLARIMGHKAAEYVQNKFPGPEYRARNLKLYQDLADKLHIHTAAMSY